MANVIIEDTGKRNFGDAIKSMKKDDWNRWRRKGWNGKNMFIHITTPPSSPFSSDNDDSFEHLPYIEIKTADNKFLPWTPSQADVLAEDWEVVE